MQLRQTMSLLHSHPNHLQRNLLNILPMSWVAEIGLHRGAVGLPGQGRGQKEICAMQPGSLGARATRRGCQPRSCVNVRTRPYHRCDTYKAYSGWLVEKSRMHMMVLRGCGRSGGRGDGAVDSRRRRLEPPYKLTPRSSSALKCRSVSPCAGRPRTRQPSVR